MELNVNFNQSIGEIISLCPPLEDWFERNQMTMAYFFFTKQNCFHYEETNASYDIKVLGRMAHVALSYLESGDPTLSSTDKAIKAAFAISYIYNKEKDNLSKIAQDNYFMELERLEVAGISR